jgi:hypothetical protein
MQGGKSRLLAGSRSTWQQLCVRIRPKACLGFSRQRQLLEQRWITRVEDAVFSTWRFDHGIVMRALVEHAPDWGVTWIQRT